MLCFMINFRVIVREFPTLKTRLCPSRVQPRDYYSLRTFTKNRTLSCRFGDDLATIALNVSAVYWLQQTFITSIDARVL
jgi:hypothetical protein